MSVEEKNKFLSTFPGIYILGDNVKHKTNPNCKYTVLASIFNIVGNPSTIDYIVLHQPKAKNARASRIERVREEDLMFTYLKDRKDFAKYGVEGYKSNRVLLKIKTLFDELVPRYKCGPSEKNGSYGFVNIVDYDKKQYYLDRAYTSTNIGPVTGIFSVYYIMKEDDNTVTDFITGNKFNIKLTKAIPFIEFTNDKKDFVIKYTAQTPGLSTSKYPHMLFDYLPSSEKTSQIRNLIFKDSFGNNYIPIVSVENAVKNGLSESLTNGYYFFNSDRAGRNKYFGYQEFGNQCNTRIGSKSASFRGTEGLKYTFGIEIEMQKCYIPSYLRPELNINCVRDGSINNRQGDRNGGPEFTTGVLQGDAGLIHLNKICNEITKRGVLDQSCGKVFATL